MTYCLKNRIRARSPKPDTFRIFRSLHISVFKVKNVLKANNIMAGCCKTHPELHQAVLQFFLFHASSEAYYTKRSDN
jgi:AICAR transformylase/IMP cyclohydrolase PurH